MINKKIFSFLVLGVFVFTLVAPGAKVMAQNSGASIEDLQKQISQLLEMIKNLQSQLNNLRGQTQPVESERGWEKVYGLITSTGINSQMWGTHQITIATGTSTKSYSVKAINSEVLEQLKKYEGQSVTLWGQLQYQNLEGGFWGFTAKRVYPEGYGCVLPAKIKIGYKGDDVKIVQQYLATDSSIYPEGLATGYYGNLTKKALEKFQEKHGLKKNGEFDEDTREELEIEIESHQSIRCIPRPVSPPTPIPNQGFKVYSPSYGEDWKAGKMHKIAWTQIWPTIAPTMTGSANTSFAPIGPVRITLHKYISCLYPEKPTDPVCMIAEAMPYVISESTENDGVFEWTIPADLAVQHRGKMIIMVASVGGGFSGRSGVFEIESQDDDDSKNKPPVVSGVSGPTNLKVGETGTWTVKAYDPENGSLSYLVNWGDEAVMSPTAGAMPKVVSVQNTATFTHVYNQTGTFYPVFYVSDDKGQQAKTSMSVVVSGGVVVNQPPAIDYLVGSTNLIVGQNGVWNFKATDPEGQNLYYGFEYGDGTSSNSSPNSSGATSYGVHAFSSPGMYTIKFGVKEVGLSDFRATKTMNVNAVAVTNNNQPPAVSVPLFGPSIVATGVNNIWSVTANDPNSDILSYRFYWGDGSETFVSAASGISAGANHIYSKMGSYTIYVTVGDSLGGGTLVSIPVSVATASNFL